MAIQIHELRIAIGTEQDQSGNLLILCLMFDFWATFEELIKDRFIEFCRGGSQ